MWNRPTHDVRHFRFFFFGCLNSRKDLLHCLPVEFWAPKFIFWKHFWRPGVKYNTTSAIITFFQGLNFSGADLSRLDLRYINFKMANLSRCNLAHANLCCANLERADLSGSVLDVRVALLKRLISSLLGKRNNYNVQIIHYYFLKTFLKTPTYLRFHYLVYIRPSCIILLGLELQNLKVIQVYFTPQIISYRSTGLSVWTWACLWWVAVQRTMVDYICDLQRLVKKWW